MRAVLQRVASAEVEADGRVTGSIEKGLLVYVGVAEGDDAEKARKLAEKVANLRIFDDENGKLNLSVRDIGGSILAVSNFTLLADTRKGRRPAFLAAASGKPAEALHDAFTDALKDEGCDVACGRFGASMKISSVADGPVNVIVDM